ncbi:hypothetical protein [Roseovarius sp. D22-M7]|uniref:hypothetical protein n=1 Tax=Roseovarius sp. D22-M7 TaxID=3127116 RepID=UPI00300FB657
MYLTNPDAPDSIEIRAAEAFAAARRCVTALHQDIIPKLQPRERLGPKRLLSAIEQRRIFETETLIELDVLIEKVSRRIRGGSEHVEQYIADECAAEGGGTITHCQLTPDAEALARALQRLLAFNQAMLDVHDMALATLANTRPAYEAGLGANACSLKLVAEAHFRLLPTEMHIALLIRYNLFPDQAWITMRGALAASQRSSRHGLSRAGGTDQS